MVAVVEEKDTFGFTWPFGGNKDINTVTEAIQYFMYKDEGLHNNYQFHPNTTVAVVFYAKAEGSIRKTS